MKINQIISEIDRRGFLKGLGAVAAGTAGQAIAAPFKHGEYTDQMTGKSQGKYSNVKSNDGSASLEIKWNAGAWLDIKNGMLYPNSYDEQPIRIKFGDNPVINITGIIVKNSSYKSLQLGESLSEAKQIANKILKHSGSLKIEVELINSGKRIIDFTIEPDTTTASITKSSQTNKQSTVTTIPQDNIVPNLNPGQIVIQIGAFADLAKANEVRSLLNKAGIKTYAQEVDTADGKRIRVRVGPFATKEEADITANNIRKLNLTTAVLKI